VPRFGEIIKSLAQCVDDLFLTNVKRGGDIGALHVVDFGKIWDMSFKYIKLINKLKSSSETENKYLRYLGIMLLI
jgi:hypothetical protein